MSRVVKWAPPAPVVSAPSTDLMCRHRPSASKRLYRSAIVLRARASNLEASRTFEAPPSFDPQTERRRRTPRRPSSARRGQLMNQQYRIRTLTSRSGTHPVTVAVGENPVLEALAQWDPMVAATSLGRCHLALSVGMITWHGGLSATVRPGLARQRSGFELLSRGFRPSNAGRAPFGSLPIDRRIDEAAQRRGLAQGTAHLD